MTFIRSLLFTTVFLIGTGLISVVCTPFLLMPVSWIRKIVRVWTSFIMFSMRKLTGLDYKIIGKENLPSGAVIIASKHQSAFETFAYPAFLDNAVFILKKELMAIPFFGWYLKKIGCVGIDRSAGASAAKKMLVGCTRELEKGKQIIIFPEGTRTAHKANKPYQSGIYLLYKRCGVPVIPVALNSGQFWGRKTFTKKAGVITIEFLPAIQTGLNKQDFLAKLKENIETAYDVITAEAESNISKNR
ncbi:MAG: 1-acyl-sn-glycerol-3-phosphate acyltransferase [Alphaproteobacteria bacterium]|nr:1-acyl-sn-glycerol-3-phosphate acyltransferase [Alphaproteobacteria bacterium]